MKDQRGAISIFLIIIFTGLMIFAGLMVDMARIIVAEKKVKNAVEATARSVLASCDTNLAGQFGLYGVNVKEQGEVADRYLRMNLVERHEGFSFIDYQVEGLSVEALPTQSLLSDEYFEEQILEYMKYKAPLIVGEDLVGKFLKSSLSKMTEAGGKAVKTSQQSKVVRQNAENVNKKIKKNSIEMSSGELASLQEEVYGTKNETTKYKNMLEESNKELEGAKGKTKLADPWLKGLEAKTQKLSDDIENNKNVQLRIEQLEAEFNNISLTDNNQDTIDYRSALSREIQSARSQLRILDKLDVPAVKNYAINGKDLKSKLKLLTDLKDLITADLNDEKVNSYLLVADDLAAANLTAEQIGDGISVQIADPTEEMAGMKSETDQPEKASLGAIGLIKDIGQGLAQIAQDGGKKIALTEYIMDKYTFVTSQTRRGHYFEYGEVEYILCGNSFQTANLAEIGAKIFAIRLGINILNELIKSLNPEPISRVGEAIVLGFTKAVLDFEKLYDGKPVELVPGVAKPAVSYSDHLRLFLLLQDKKSHFDHMRQMIQVDLNHKDNKPKAQEANKFNLKDHSTVITVKAEVRINLLFSQVLPLDKINPRFSKGGYLINKMVTVGY